MSAAAAHALAPAAQDAPPQAPFAPLAAPPKGDGETGLAPTPAEAYAAALPRLDRPRGEDGAPLETSYDRALAPLLEALGWRGEPRDLIEAAPHGAPIDEAETLIDVLERLGYRAERAELSLAECPSGAFPLLYWSEDELRLARGRNAEGALDLVLLAAGAAPTERTEAAPQDLVAALCAAPSARPAKAAPSPGESWLALRLETLRDPLLGVLALSLLINFLAIATPLYSMTVYNEAIPSQSLDTLGFLTLLVLGALLTEDRLRRLRGTLAADVAERIHGGLLSSAWRKITSLPLGVLEAAPQSARLAQLKRLEGAPAPLHGPLAAALLDAPFALIFIAVIAMLAGPLALAPLALAGALLLYAALSRSAARRADAQRARLRRASQDLLQEGVAARRAIRAAGAERVWLQRLGAALAEEADANAHQEVGDQIAGHVAQGAVALAAVAMLGFGALAVIEGALSVGALIAVVMLMWKALSPFQTAFLALGRIRAAREDAALADALMRLPEERQLAAPPITRAPRGAMAFDAVAWRPQGAREFALRGLSFTLRPGERLGLMGGGGAGRTTALRLALGLDDPSIGAITLDGAPLAQTDPRRFRAACAYAPERPEFAGDSLAETMRLMRDDLSDAEIMFALEALETPLDPDLFPEGLATRLDAARRARLGPEILQRLNLVRAQLAARPFLMLDEPTAPLDAPARAAFLGWLGAHRGPTTLIATNDADALRLCDSVIALSQGRMIAAGAPEAVFAALAAEPGAQAG